MPRLTKANLSRSSFPKQWKTEDSYAARRNENPVSFVEFHKLNRHQRRVLIGKHGVIIPND